MLNGMDLFSGIGGMSVALSEWVRPIAYCEIDPYCQGVLLSRICEGSLEYAPIWDDIKTLQGGYLPDSIDILYGGFPCQDISIAGHGKGLAGKQSGLFFEIVRLAKEIKPTFIFLENVPTITSRGGLQVVNEITSLGYDCRWCIISAASVGTLHKRERWFILAHSNSKRLQEESRQSMRQKERFSMPINQTEHGFKYKEPENKLVMAGMANDIPNRMDRTRALGNAVVPKQAKEAFKILMGLKWKK